MNTNTMTYTQKNGGKMYEDWADKVERKKIPVPEVTADASDSGSQFTVQWARRRAAEEYNAAIEKEQQKLRQEQVKAYRLDQFIEQTEADKDTRTVAQDKPAPEYADPKRLSEDPDFRGVDREGIDLAVPSPNRNVFTLDVWKSDTFDAGKELVKYYSQHINPEIMKKSSGMDRFVRKAFCVMPPTYAPEEFRVERAGQFRRDEEEAAAAIDALLNEQGA